MRKLRSCKQVSIGGLLHLVQVQGCSHSQPQTSPLSLFGIRSSTLQPLLRLSSRQRYLMLIGSLFVSIVSPDYRIARSWLCWLCTCMLITLMKPLFPAFALHLRSSVTACNVIYMRIDHNVIEAHMEPCKMTQIMGYVMTCFALHLRSSTSLFSAEQVVSFRACASLVMAVCLIASIEICCDTRRCQLLVVIRAPLSPPWLQSLSPRVALPLVGEKSPQPYITFG